MIVEKYKRKINPWLKAYKFLYKFRVMLIAFAVLLSSTAVTLLSIKGLVTDVIKISDSFYGDKLDYESKGIFENYIHYEFKTESATEWSKEVPYKAGTYQIRGVSKDIFGNFRNGSETTFTIKPKIVEVNIKSESITYGDRPTLDIDLAFQDKIIDFDFEYSELDVDSMSASLYIDYESIVVVNSSNEDVTSCYNFNGSASSSSTLSNNNFKVNLKKRNIVFETNDIYEYDGNEHAIENIKIYEGELYEGDSYLIDKHNYEVYGGFYKSFPVLKFVNKSGKNITKLYSYSFSSSSYLTISAREITIETMDFSKEYDGRVSTFNNRYKITEGSLVNGDKLELGCPNFVNAGNYENRPNYTFISKDGNNVSRSYKLTIKPGKYVINPKKFRIKQEGLDKEYDGYTHYCRSEYDENQLIEGHTLVRYRNYEDTMNDIHVGTYETFCRYLIEDANNKDVSSNYEFIITKDSVTISKRNITIETGTGKVEYTGNLVGYPDYSIKSGTLAETDSLACLTFRQEVELGTYENEMTFSITHKAGKDVTNDYNINILLGRFTIVEEVNGGEGPGIGPGGEPDGKDPMFDPLNPFEPSSEEGEGYLFKYNTNTSGNIYFRQLVLGDYTKRGFTSAPELYLDEQSVNPIYHFYNANVSSIKPSFMNIEYEVDQTEHDPVPYNIKESSSYTPIDDNSFQYEGKNHSFEYIYYDYIEDKGKSLRKYTGVGSEEYADRVRRNYSEVPDSTRTALLKIINSNNLRKNTTYDTIKAVKDYVQNVAEYSFGVSYVDSEDYVIDFLTKTKKGICVHYASAATLILRCLGYSSRIACGYSGGEAIANKDMFVGAEKAHAWTEVFLEEYNQWVNIEVTASSSGGSGGGSGGGGSPGTTESIIITSGSQNFVYDREYHSYPEYTLSKELPASYTLNVEFLSNIQNVGSVNNAFTYTVTDKNGKDVTMALNIKARFGVLSVLPRKLLVKTEDKTISLKDLSNYYPEYRLEGNIVTLNQYTQTFVSAITKPGTYENVVFVHKLEEMDTGIDVTNNYKIEYDYGTLTVTP